MGHILDQKVSIIGSGRVATSLVHAFKAKGILVNEIYSRSIDHANKLSAAISSSTATNSLDFSKSQSDIFIIAISDDAIGEVSKKISFPEISLVAHTSGTVSLNTLKHSRSGIFYPLQTFTIGKKVDFQQVPILIDGKSNADTQKLKELGAIISSQVSITTEAERQKLHIAAVFASNFVNRMLAASEEILNDTSLNLNILKPLVFESIQNAFESNPDQALTGPAKRGDQSTIQNHLNALEEKPELKSIYMELTKMIISKT
ncbi:MAG: DUF2520 domain-containing protein [Reichenbachiella sp.]|uniref:Rossmann-like and DUF2520 domain-containing protein n=1 Tax=Reichenbachiella sp. TaxID=2184521 RepID=UPI0032988675